MTKKFIPLVKPAVVFRTLVLVHSYNKLLKCITELVDKPRGEREEEAVKDIK